jgi:hypothetical protein
MGNVQIKLNIPGLRELRNDNGVMAELQKQANRIAQRAGEGFEADTATKGSTRARCRVHAGSAEAYYKNLKHNTLLKAIK